MGELMENILIAGAGGSASTNYVRSLRIAPESFYIVGVDCNKYYLQRAETDKKYLGVIAASKEYIKTLNKIIDKERIDFIHAQNDAEVFTISKYRQQLHCKVFLPLHQIVAICQDKFLSYCYWEKVFKKPKTKLVIDKDGLENFFKENQGDFWIRDIKGAGGKGSLKTNSFEKAFNWITYHNGWGRYTIAEYLSSQSTTFTTIWENGILIAGQGRKRLYWELGPAFISGVSGATGAGAIDNTPMVADTAIKAIKTIDVEPNGIYSVDLTYGQDGIPYPTEINIGRFFTTHYFFAKAGFNMAYIYTQLGLGRKVRVQKINPLQEGLVWIRGMDFEPVLTTMKKINEG